MGGARTERSACLEKARYERPRYCKACGMDEYVELRNAIREPDQLDRTIESETHFLFWCGLYGELRRKCLGRVATPENFDLLSIGERYSIIFLTLEAKQVS